ncbi:MAG: hypothetical protein ACI9FR_002566 [Cryomorphaceae bacterium]|jgi:uncharacterized protein (DUF885 family)
MSNLSFRRFGFVASFLVLLIACSPPQEKAAVIAESVAVVNVSEEFNSMLDAYYQDGLKLDSISATFAGDNRYNDLFLNDLSEEGKNALLAHYDKYSAAVGKFSNGDLNESEQMSKAILEWELDLAKASMSFDSDLTPIDQMWSVNLIMGQLASGASAQPFVTVEDYDNWLKRVDAYLEWLASAKTKMQTGIEKGYVLPKSLIKKVVPQLRAMTEANTQEHLFYGPLKQLPESFSAEQKEQITAQYTSMIETKVVPVYQDLAQFMETDYMSAGRDSSGITAVPNGEAFYQHQIKLYTTTTMSAEDIHQLGLSEVSRILGEMEKVKQQVNYQGDLKSFFNFVRENKELMPYSEPQEIIDFFGEIHERMAPQLEQLFDLKPKSAFEVRRTEEFRQDSASAEYNSGSLDGTRPGIFYTPIPNAAEYNIYDAESLFLHEAIPGHHYQISLTQENPELPMFRKTLWYSGYGEGWALYTESLGKELGLYTDPYQYFGMLSAEMHRAIRLVVDTGLHSKGWTREKAIQYSLDNEAESAASIEREIERYMANPGQALAYKIGQLKIRELRGFAEDELGEKFSIAQFHNQVLETGCVPLALLENKIRNWVAASK